MVQEDQVVKGVRVPELNYQETGVVIIDHGSVKQESNQRLLELVELFRQKTHYKTVQPAHMELAAPSMADAFQECVKHDVKLIVVSPFFLLPGKHWQQDIPRLAKEASMACDDIPYLVAAPMGVHELLVDVMNSRIEFCASARAGNLCNCCSEQVNCRTHSPEFTG